MKSVVLAALALVIGLAACNPTLAAQTLAPPGRTARLDAVDGFWSVKHYRLEITQGVAMAFTCMRAGPCEHVTVTSDDPAIAEPRTASLGRLEPNSGGPSYGANPWQNQATAAATVVVGKGVGTTRLHLHSKDGDRLIIVTVVPAPSAKPVTPAVAEAVRSPQARPRP